MSKEKIAEKLGWKTIVYEDHLDGDEIWWVSPNGTEYGDLPNWENSLDAQARDIWPYCKIKGYRMDIVKAIQAALFEDKDLAQACWQAICEVFGVESE